jgi:hypothetical protein
MLITVLAAVGAWWWKTEYGSPVSKDTIAVLPLANER